MSHARDLLSSLLATKSSPDVPVLRSTSTEVPPSSHLSATVVNKPPSITSVQAFNAQLTIGGKDEALRKAADVFKTAAENMEKARQRGEKYWLDALKIRRANWRLVPAPLPLGSSTGKGTDKTAKDFLIVYGLEECVFCVLLL
jgi:mediator of RNA polymerase II transcription subunit 17